MFASVSAFHLTYIGFFNYVPFLFNLLKKVREMSEIDNVEKVYLAAKWSLIAAFLSVTVPHVAPLLDDPEGTIKALEAQNYEPVDVGGGVWFGAGFGDLWRTEFTAKNLKGELVDGYATKGIFKGTTLREITLVEPQ